MQSALSGCQQSITVTCFSLLAQVIERDRQRLQQNNEFAQTMASFSMVGMTEACQASGHPENARKNRYRDIPA